MKKIGLTLLIFILLPIHVPLNVNSQTTDFQIAITNLQIGSQELVGVTEESQRYLVTISFQQKYWNAKNESVWL